MHTLDASMHAMHTVHTMHTMHTIHAMHTMHAMHAMHAMHMQGLMGRSSDPAKGGGGGGGGGSGADSATADAADADVDSDARTTRFSMFCAFQQMPAEPHMCVAPPRIGLGRVVTYQSILRLTYHGYTYYGSYLVGASPRTDPIASRSCCYSYAWTDRSKPSPTAPRTHGSWYAP